MTSTPEHEGDDLPFCICGGDVHGLHLRECPWYERADDCPLDHMRWSLTDEEYARAFPPTLMFSKSRPLTEEAVQELMTRVKSSGPGYVLQPGHQLVITPGSPVTPRDIRMARVHRLTQQAIAAHSWWRTMQAQQLINPSPGDEERVEAARIEHEQKEQALYVLIRSRGWQEGDRARNGFNGNGPFANAVGTLERSWVWDRFTLMLDEPVRWFDFEGKPHVEESCIVSADKLLDLDD